MKFISQIINTHNIPVGEHTMTQPLPSRNIEQHSPYILIHHHGPHVFAENNGGLPFGPHPHRGFETLTFVLQGDIQHHDSEGFKSTINAGGVQWMTAGSGILHSENLSEQMLATGGTMEMIQIWMNLPSALKMVAPTYQGLQKEEIQTVNTSESSVQVISGNYFDTKGKANSISGLDILNISAKENARIPFRLFENKNTLVYVYGGEIEIEGNSISKGQMITFNKIDENFEINCKKEGGFIFLAGNPINEPMVSHGPFVMNTETEIRQAFHDFNSGKFGRM